MTNNLALPDELEVLRASFHKEFPMLPWHVRSAIPSADYFDSATESRWRGFKAGATCGREQERAELTGTAMQEQGNDAKLLEEVTKAILFEDCGSTVEWKENTNLGEAALKVIRDQGSAYCQACQATGLRHCSDPFNCGCARCSTCHQVLALTKAKEVADAKQ